MARKSSNRTWWILGGVVVVLAIGIFAGKQFGWIGQAKPMEVDFAKVKRTSIVERVTASGRVQPEVEVKLSPDVSGEIIGLYVAEGDSVIKGQLLLKIRPDNYASQMARAEATVNANKAGLEQSRAALAQAESRLIRAKANYDRNKKLFEDKVISESDFEQINADYQVARQDVDAAKANIKAADYNIKSAEASMLDAAENLRKTTIFAPVSGIISLLNVEAGERVVGTSQMAGTELMRIANLANMEVRVNVNENDIVRVSLGDTAEIDIDAYSGSGRKFKGVVREIANTANGLASSTSTSSMSSSTDAVTEFEVKVKILNESFLDLMESMGRKSYPFKPGMTASVDIITDRKENILAVPIAAVTTRTGQVQNKTEGQSAEGENTAADSEKAKGKSPEPVKEVVFIEEEGKAKLQAVTTGISDFENIEIKSGLTEGQNVISGPFSAVSKRLNEGDAITDAAKVGKKDTDKSNEKKN